MIRAVRVRRSFGRVRALDDLSFSVAAGEAVALWGTNGAGKTTFLRCALGVIAFRGSIRVAGLDVRRRGKQVRALVGYVPQELAFHDDMRVDEALRFFGALRGVDAERGRKGLADVGLCGHGRKRVRELSGGMKQRLALALALVADPPIILLDEPTSNLDAHAREDVVATLARLKRDGKTILFASHRAEEVAALADRVVRLEKGRLVSDQPAAEFADHAGAFLLRLDVGPDQREAAVATLARSALDARLNGRGVYVEVSAAAKAEPIRILTQAGVVVRDFDVITGAGAAREDRP